MQTNNTIERIKRQIANNPVLLYLKGTPDFPMCGFSGRVIHILKGLNAKYAYVNVLENPDIRAELPGYASWPTFPQFYIDGELIGGCDILTELNHNGELEPMLASVDAVLASETHAILAHE